MGNYLLYRKKHGWITNFEHIIACDEKDNVKTPKDINQILSDNIIQLKAMHVEVSDISCTQTSNSYLLIW